MNTFDALSKDHNAIRSDTPPEELPDFTKVRHWAVEHAQDLARMGVRPEDFLAHFKKLNKSKGMTANEFLGIVKESERIPGTQAAVSIPDSKLLKAPTSAQFSEQLASETKRAKIMAFVEREKETGRIAPWELRPRVPGGPTILDRLMRADDRAIIRRFRENGKVVCHTELDAQLAEIRGRRPRKFKPDIEDELAKVRQFAEEKAEDLARISTTPEKLVACYLREKARNTELTAAAFIGR